MFARLAKAYTVFSMIICLGAVGHAHAQTPAKEIFGNTPLPALSEPQVHGFYSKGCIGGAVAIPVDGPTWQAMRLERNRRWGHPDLIELVQTLSRETAANDGWPGLLVGDISQPRGGPMLSGHASHQIGLDADIWLTPMPERRLSKAERRDTSATSMLKDNGNSLYVDDTRWTDAHGRLLRRAASYDAVERIFIHPGIKKKMCDIYGAQNSNDRWMIKLRPYYGHHYNFHIRIKCPADSPGCRPQAPVPASGNGCDASLDWWFTSEPWTPKKPEPGTKPKKPRIVTLNDLPGGCASVLQMPQPASENLVTLDAQYNAIRAMASAVPSPVPLAIGSAVIPVSKLPQPGTRPSNP